MKLYWVDFSASLLVDAENEEDAKNLAMNIIPCDYNFIEIDGVEELKIKY